jgi:hypothetical protein
VHCARKSKRRVAIQSTCELIICCMCIYIPLSPLQLPSLTFAPPRMPMTIDLSAMSATARSSRTPSRVLATRSRRCAPALPPRQLQRRPLAGAAAPAAAAAGDGGPYGAAQASSDGTAAIHVCFVIPSSSRLRTADSDKAPPDGTECAAAGANRQHQARPPGHPDCLRGRHRVGPMLARPLRARARRVRTHQSAMGTCRQAADGAAPDMQALRRHQRSRLGRAAGPAGG